MMDLLEFRSFKGFIDDFNVFLSDFLPMLLMLNSRWKQIVVSAIMV